MAVPKRRKSKSRKGMRRAHDHAKLLQPVACPQCNEPVLPHHVCPHCGVYKGRTIIEQKEES
jgi:large subunit ribosomal protein L32